MLKNLAFVSRINTICRKLTTHRMEGVKEMKNEKRVAEMPNLMSEQDYQTRLDELKTARMKYGTATNMQYLELRNGVIMPAIAIGTSLVDPRLIVPVVCTAIELGYRHVDTAFIYGTEIDVGQAINMKIKDGTVTRDDLFITSKLWNTFHRRDLVEKACRASLDAMGLDYFDLFLIHAPMSFKEGGEVIPKIANVLQFSEYDYLDAWFGMEDLLEKGLVKSIGVSNFNSAQLARVLEKGKVKPVVNQVEGHPYLNQVRLAEFCEERNVRLVCYGTLGSKGTPDALKSSDISAIDDPQVKRKADEMKVTPAQLLIRYQLDQGRGVVVKASSGSHLWDVLHALTFRLNDQQIEYLHSLNRNRRSFAFKGMGDTHKNYPFSIAF